MPSQEPLLFRCSRAFVARIAAELHPIGLLRWAARRFASVAIGDFEAMEAQPSRAEYAVMMPFLRTSSLSFDGSTAFHCAVDGPDAEMDSAIIEAALEAMECCSELLDGYAVCLHCVFSSYPGCCLRQYVLH